MFPGLPQSDKSLIPFPGFPVPSKAVQAFPDFRSVVISKAIEEGPVRGLDSDNKGPNLALSNNNLTVSNTGVADWEQVLGDFGRDTGKWYFEVEMVSGGPFACIGVQDGTESLETYLGDTLDGWGYMANARFYNSGIRSPTGGLYETGDIVMVAVDSDAHKIWWGLNGTWKGVSEDSPDPGAGIDPGYDNLYDTVLYPAITLYSTTDVATIRFVEDDFSYALPTGFGVA